MTPEPAAHHTNLLIAGGSQPDQLDDAPLYDNGVGGVRKGLEDDGGKLFLTRQVTAVNTTSGNESVGVVT